MATKNLQTLVLRAALNAGARATGTGRKGFVANNENPANVLSLPSRPVRGCYRPDEDSEHRDSVSMASAVVRAGRPAAYRGAAFGAAITRTPATPALSPWSRGTTPFAKPWRKPSSGGCGTEMLSARQRLVCPQS